MIPQLTASQFTDWAHSSARPLLLDVREPWECQTASVPPGEDFDRVFIPMGELSARWVELPQDRPIACLCHHGMRSQQVALFLQRQGFAEVVNLQGGIDAWSRDVDPSIPRY